jgi:folate-dependent phosphoribosylglycinamide formyltransferase PurN
MPLPSARESAAETAAAVQLAEQQAAEAIVEQQQDTADHLRAVREVAHQMTANVSDAISTLGYQRALAPSALR